MKSQRKVLTFTETVIKQVRFAGTDKPDLLAYYKAYQLGALKAIHPDFDKKTLLSREEFDQLFTLFVNTNNLLSVTFFGFKDDVEVPIGVGLFWKRGRLIDINHLTWFPWATPRQIFTSTYNFYDTLRKTTDYNTGKKFKVMGFTRKSDEPFFKRLIDLKVIEKVGEADGLFPNEKGVFLVTKELEDKS